MTNPKFIKLVRKWVLANFPGLVPTAVTVKFLYGESVRIPVPPLASGGGTGGGKKVFLGNSAAANRERILQFAPKPDEEPVPWQELASRAGCKRNSNFRRVLTQMVNEGLLDRISGRYRLSAPRKKA